MICFEFMAVGVAGCVFFIFWVEMGVISRIPQVAYPPPGPSPGPRPPGLARAVAVRTRPDRCPLFPIICNASPGLVSGPIFVAVITGKLSPGIPSNNSTIFIQIKLIEKNRINCQKHIAFYENIRIL